MAHVLNVTSQVTSPHLGTRVQYYPSTPPVLPQYSPSTPPVLPLLLVGPVVLRLALALLIAVLAVAVPGAVLGVVLAAVLGVVLEQCWE